MAKDSAACPSETLAVRVSVNASFRQFNACTCGNPISGSDRRPKGEPAILCKSRKTSSKRSFSFAVARMPKIIAGRPADRLVRAEDFSSIRASAFYLDLADSN